MQRWEYRVVSLRAGTYTASLNAYGLEGWELISVTEHGPEAPPTEPGSSSIPMPRALGRLEDAAARINKLGGKDAPDEAMTNLLWVLRRPLGEEA
jgi:hypothetical protein